MNCSWILLSGWLQKTPGDASQPRGQTLVRRGVAAPSQKLPVWVGVCHRGASQLMTVHCGKKDVLIIPVLSFYGSSPGSPHPLNDGKERFHSGERGQDLKRESWYAQRPSFQANRWAPRGSSEPLCSASGRLQRISGWFLQSKVTFMFVQFWLKLFLSPVSEGSWGTSWGKTPLYKSSCSV